MTNADAIRQFNDEELAKMLSAVTVVLVRDTAKGVSNAILDFCGLPASAELLNGIIDEHCKADDGIFEWYLRFLQLEYGQTTPSG